MKRALYLTLLFFALSVPNSIIAQNLPEIELSLRETTPVELRAGTFIPVINAQEISTQYFSEGYKVHFISTTDLFMYDSKVIPEDSIFEGYIEKIHEPVVGTNASMVIRISKMIFPDGFENPIKGYIYTSNNNIIGGGISEPAEWVKMPHYQNRFRGIATLQIKPGEKRKMGEHTTLQSGLDLIIILTEPIEITHILTDWQQTLV